MSDEVARWVRIARVDDSSAHAEAVRRLIELLDDGDAFVRSEAADALGPLGDVAAVAALERALIDTEPVVRAAAAESLGDLAAPESLDSLVAAARGDTDEAVRAYAASSLGLIGASDDLLRALQAAELSAWVRAELGIARYRLGAITIDEAIEPLARAEEVLLLRLVNGLRDLVDRGGAMPNSDVAVVAQALEAARFRVPGVP